MLITFFKPLPAFLLEQLLIHVEICVLDGVFALLIKLAQQDLDLAVGEVSHLDVFGVVPSVFIKAFFDALLQEREVRGGLGRLGGKSRGV